MYEILYPGGRLARLLALPILLCLLATLGEASHAQQEVPGGILRGILLDELTSIPVSEAEVRLLTTDGQVLALVLSDGEGRFTLQTPGPGAFRIRVERMGYQVKESGEFSIPPGHVLTAEVYLSPQPLPLDALAVLGQRRELRATEQLIQGRLRDYETGEPVSNGTVYLLKAQGLREDDFGTVDRMISDDQGLFTLISPLPGTYRLRAERLGYRTSDSGDLHLMPGDTVVLDLYMSMEAIVLDPITVRASARPWESRYSLLGMESFFNRQSRFGPSGQGAFLTRDSLARFDGRMETGRMLLAVVPAVRFLNNQGGVVLARECNPRYYLDGFEIVRGDPVHRSMLDTQASTPHSQGFDPELMYLPESLEAIEVYLSPVIPAEFSQGYPCGVVALWTRRRR